jgi:hypothetical protein
LVNATRVSRMKVAPAKRLTTVATAVSKVAQLLLGQNQGLYPHLSSSLLEDSRLRSK